LAKIGDKQTILFFSSFINNQEKITKNWGINFSEKIEKLY